MPITEAITFIPEKRLNKLIRRLARATNLPISRICSEIMLISFRSGLTKDLFWFYIKEPKERLFLDSQRAKGIDKLVLLKDALSSIETIFTEQENRITSLETNTTKIVNKIIDKRFKQLSLTDFLKGSGG